MKILNKHYYDDNGNPVSEEEFQILYQEFENKYKKKAVHIQKPLKTFVVE